MNLKSKAGLISDKKRIEWFPAFWLMRIKVLEIHPDWRHIKIRLPHSWIATNIGGSLFGGFQACRFIPVFDREGYSPAFFRKMWDKHRIANTHDPKFSFITLLGHSARFQQNFTLCIRSNSNFTLPTS